MTAKTRRPETTFSAIFQMRSIKTRVTLFTLGIFLIGIWSLAFYSSRMLRTDIELVLNEKQMSTASFMATAVNEELTERMTILKGIAKQAVVVFPARRGEAKTAFHLDAKDHE
jgi:hypothetical protein